MNEITYTVRQSIKANINHIKKSKLKNVQTKFLFHSKERVSTLSIAINEIVC